jgi:BASS family bile acid:Na+ symporter
VGGVALRVGIAPGRLTAFGSTKGTPIERLRLVENNLLPLVVVTAAVGLVWPSMGVVLAGAVTPLLALLILAVSLTFDAATLRAVLRRPGLQALATLLVYVPMSLGALVIAEVTFESGPLWLGMVLLGTLPTDVSSPLLVWIGRGNVALATVFNAVNTSIAPVVVPALFLLYTGVELEVPVAALSGELAVTVLVPTFLGVAIRTRWPARIRSIEPVLSAAGSLTYLALLLAAIGPNAGSIVGAPGAVLMIGGAALALNATGYAIAAAVGRLLAHHRDRVAMLFTVSKKEFSIAAFVVFASGLPPETAIPAVVYAVVQMITSPAVARTVARRSRPRP